ncbi:MAG: NAD-binding protein [Burkholderiaceae bacterium]|nr:NAD-binding protein [Microbacteriaceae bacterium]
MTAEAAQHRPQQGPQHRAVLAASAGVVADASRPTVGPIALLPHGNPVFEAAVVAGGGTVTALTPQTRGIVWLASADPDGLVAVLAANPQVEWVQLPWAGVDAFSSVLAPFADHPLPLWTSAKGAYAQPVAEHALTLVLAVLRVIPTRVRATGWSALPEGRSLYGLRIVLVGAGGIAIELLRLLAPFGVEVTVVRRSSEPLPSAARTVTVDRLDEVLPTADVVVIAAALTGGTTGLFDARRLSLLGRHAVLVNIARGGLVDTDALTDALAAGRLAGAGLDVTVPEPLPDGHPLWNEPRVIITPHSADTPDMTAPLLAERIRLNVAAFTGDGRFVGVVDPSAGY